MANEITFRGSLQVRKLNSSNLPQIDFQSRPSAFNADLSTAKQLEFAIHASLTGTDVDLSLLQWPGYYFFHNHDSANRVEYGIHEPLTGIFYPWGEIDATFFALGKFSRNFQEQFGGTVTGTGTDAGVNNTLRFKAYGAAVHVSGTIFEAT